MLGAAAAVDDGDTDARVRAGSHNLERLPPAGWQHTIRSVLAGDRVPWRCRRAGRRCPRCPATSARTRRGPGRPSAPAGRPRCGCRRNWWRRPAGRCARRARAPRRRRPVRTDTSPPNRLICAHATVVGRIVGQARVAHRPHGRVVTQHRRHRQGVVALPLEAQPRAAEAAQHQPRLERAENRPGQQPFAFDGGHQVGVAARDVAGEQVAVAGQRLGGAGHHEVGAERQRLLPKRCGGGVVDDQAGAAAAADHRQPVQVDDVERRVDRASRRARRRRLGGVAHVRAASPRGP